MHSNGLRCVVLYLIHMKTVKLHTVTLEGKHVWKETKTIPKEPDGVGHIIPWSHPLHVGICPSGLTPICGLVYHWSHTFLYEHILPNLIHLHVDTCTPSLNPSTCGHRYLWTYPSVSVHY